jgi:hypothetical protein
MRRRLTILLIVLALPATAATAATAAEAAVYKDKTGLGGGRIILTIENGKLKRLRGALPAHCERDNGDFNTTLTTHLVGSVKLDGKGRFGVHVDDPNTGVEVIIGGKLKNGSVRGAARFTYLELHPGSPSNDTLCDSGVLRYRAG